MNDMIERYVYDVARRLPEKDRKEVMKELRANIYDMLPDNAGDEDVKRVLYELGEPASLAEQYRTKPRYLISPAYFDEYVGVLKWVLPLVGVIMMIVGFAIGAFDAAKEVSTGYALVAGSILSNGVSMGISAALQALIWTTVGFVIAERSGAKKQKPGEHGWRIEDLPELKQDKTGIPLSEGISELVVTVIFSILGLLFCAGRLPFAIAISSDGLQFYQIFSDSFLALCVPMILVSLALTVVVAVVKIRDRSWTPLVCAAVVVKSLVNMALSLWLINRPNMFSDAFRSYLADAGLAGLVPSIDGKSVIIIVLSVLIIIGTVGDCFSSVKKTVGPNAKLPKLPE